MGLKRILVADDDVDICAQVLDLGTNNKIQGYKECRDEGDDDDD